MDDKEINEAIDTIKKNYWLGRDEYVDEYIAERDYAFDIINKIIDERKIFKKAYELACETISKQENDSCYYCLYQDECFNKDGFRDGSCPAYMWEKFFIKKAEELLNDDR